MDSEALRETRKGHFVFSEAKYMAFMLGCKTWLGVMVSETFFGKDKLPRACRTFVFGVVLVGVPTFLYCVVDASRQHGWEWLPLAVLTLVSSLFPIRVIPSVREGKTHTLVVTVSDVFVFLGLMLFGPSVAASLATLDGATTGIRDKSSRLYKHFFNLSLLCIAAWVSGWCFHLLMGVPPPLGNPSRIGDDFGVFFALTGVASLIFYTINSGGVVLAIALATGRSIAQAGKENFFTSSLATLAGSSVAAFIFLNLDRGGRILSFLVAVPIVVALYYGYRLNTNRINAALAHADQMKQIFHSTIASLAMAIDAKDQYTHGHVNRVQQLVVMIAEKLRWKEGREEGVEGLKAAALLHDIGKLAIPEYILNKPSGLTKWEIQKMQIHPDVSAEILETVPFPYEVVPYVRHHHEKWDGTGYPDGLKGTDIPLGARILSVADCYDALRSDRPYRAAMSREVALEYITGLARKSYDPAVVDVLVGHIDEFESKLAESEAAKPVRTETVISSTQEPVPDANTAKTVFHDIASAHREIQAVYEISESVGRTLNVSETLALVTTKISNLVPYDGCAIFLADPHTDLLLPYNTSGELTEELDKLRVTMGAGVTGWVAANNQMLANVSPAPDFADHPRLKEAFHSCVSIPLSLDDRVVGVITVYAKVEAIFQDNHLRLLDTLARQAAAAVNNAIVYEETQEDAYTDALTGLPNLRYFRVFGDQELRRAGRVDYPVTLLMMDLDAFKGVNDSWGHRIGDRVLIEVSHILRTQVRRSDTCIRYGGDEFVGLLPGAGRELAESTIKRLQEAVAAHEIVLRMGEVLRVSLSVGSATFPHDAKDLDLLLALADQAMYQDKLRLSPARSAAILPFDLRGEA